MRVLVTGHRGYIGSVMTRLLAAAGHEVVGLDVDLYAACSFAGDPPAVPDVAVDVRDATAAALEGVEAVVHLAALSNDPLGELDADLTHDINHRASLRLARLARGAGVSRFVFASSCSVYGASSRRGSAGRLTEASPRAPITAYAVSKARVEDGLRGLAYHGFSPTILRNATAYGVSPRLRLDIVLNDLVAQAVTTGVIRLRSAGLAWRPMVHVEDICQAVARVLEAPRELIHGEVFNVGATSENHRVIDMAEAVRRAVPGTTLEVAAGAPADARDYDVDCEKIRRVLPFEPRWTLARGAEELAHAYRAAGLEARDLPRYTRLAEIRRRLAAGELTPDLRAARGDAALRAA